MLQVSHAQTNTDFQNTILHIHNQERAAVNIPALTWNNNLAAAAQTWATHLTTLGLTCTPQQCNMPHDPSRGFVGENLWMDGVGLSSTAQQVEDWVYEKNNYHGGPYNLQPGDPVIGHYAQMVWRNTNEIGCATASDGTMDFLVCRYSPLGNVRGQNPY